MHRQPLLTLLSTYRSVDPHEEKMRQEIIAFVRQYPDCFERSLKVGHITGSAWIVNPERDAVVLIHHRKLDRWLQPGGHADGNPDVLQVARREAGEETGLNHLRTMGPGIFDVDIHPIPARGDEPEHLHYDIRFCLEADPVEPFRPTAETKGIRWVHFDEITDFTEEESVLRMVRKKKT
ncbi:NUDIX hydrolase [Larkinella soli]|uniref:NUDIX hydrolase n=1 Tax=Larkinella soli TaxID=1770527 RepID=UPI000FFC2A3A|nr:NUDIX hydrolase [Larkinella soli]